MQLLNYRQQELFIEDVALQDVAAEFGTPCYVYSQTTILKNWQAYLDALDASGQPSKVYYAVKANPNIHILRLLSQQGAGFDVVSGGEIKRALAAGATPKDIIFSGVGKSVAEINYAIEIGIHSIHIESEAELQRVQTLAMQQHKSIDIALRINPDVDSGTHQYISTGSHNNKFGIGYNKAVELYLLAKSMPNIKIKGIACHIGSQITTLQPFLQALDQLLMIIDELKVHDIILQYIDMGGGLGIRYVDENPPSALEYVKEIARKLAHSNLELHLEPGRSIVADAGILLTKIEYLKTTDVYNFAVVDAAMNDLIRPALYDSYHELLPVTLRNLPKKNYSVVGPVCESGDFLALDRSLQITADDLLVIRDCGAYGFSMSSNYNTRPRCAEVLVAGNSTRLIRKRENIKELLANEML